MEKVDSECHFSIFHLQMIVNMCVKSAWLQWTASVHYHLMLIDIQYKHKEISAYLLKLKKQLQEIKNEYISDNL